MLLCQTEKVATFSGWRYYGFRWVRRVDSETGKEVLQQKPLSPQDFLDPQEGDRFPQAPIDETDTTDATSIFRYLYRDNSTIVVLSDVKILWGITGHSEPAWPCAGDYLLTFE